MTLAETLEARFRRELAEAREALALVLEAPFYVANSLVVPEVKSIKGYALLGGTETGLPALFRLPGGEWRPNFAGGSGGTPASCGEVLELLEKHAPNIAEREARVMTLAGELLMPDAEERAACLERAVEAWPWPSTVVLGNGNVSEFLPFLVVNLADLVHVVRSGQRADRRGAMFWSLSDPAEWTAEALERRSPGEGAEYRSRYGARPAPMSYDEGPGDDGVKPRGLHATVIAIPTTLALAPRDVAGTLPYFVTLEQLEVLYQALPPAVLHARALRRDVERIASGDEPRSRLERVAKLALAKADADASDDACDKLAGALRRTVEKLRPILRLDTLPPTTGREALELLDTINEAFAVYVEKRGNGGETVAGEVRSHAKRDAKADAAVRWAFWRAEPGAEPPWLVALAVVVWLHETKREVTERAALVMPVHDDLARFHSRTHILETRDGQRALTFDDSDPFVLIPTVGGDVIAALVEQGIKNLGSVPAYHLLRWEVLEVHARVMRGEPDARVLQHDGSWDSFTHDVLGLPGKSVPRVVRAVAWTQDAVRFPTADGDTARLINLREKPNQGRRRGSLEFLVGTVLLPHYGFGLPKSADRRLVPMLRELPPMAGRTNEHGAVMTLSMLLMRELRARARELVTDGAVAISGERWKALAIQAGLPLVTLPKVIDRWLQNGTDGPALLSSPWAGGYTLGDAHEPERDFLVAAGKRSTVRSAAGQRSVQANNRKRNGRGGR